MTVSPLPPAQRRPSRVPAMADGDVVAILADIARTLKSRELEITAGMSALMAREIENLGEDPQLAETLEASVHGNVSTVILVLANDIPVDHLQPPTAAIEYALRLAQREVPSNSLVRAYHMGQNEMLRICYDEIDRRALSAPLALAVIKRLTGIIYSYIDWITLAVFDAYEAERSRWSSFRGSVRSSTVHAVLSTDTPDTASFEAETGYRLSRTHLALILWRPGPEQPSTLHLLDTHARAIARGLHAESPPIVTAIDRHTAWAWLPFGLREPITKTTELCSMVDLTDGTRLAVGLPGEGLGGFRRSHQQARAAYFVATVPGAPPPPPVVGFGDPGVAAISLLAKDLDSARAWVQEVLGELADDTDQAAILRHTLSTYYATSESHVHTAQILTLHRNTVKYRVTKAIEATRSSTVPHDELDIALALQICRLLGARVLRRTT
ncbi:helix-turn-helix domain-containing protein [Nocardia sp. NPDC051787]|uniref:PucR family transcriptional regulator n=1 Tax=Nocardia sp. NPDC051787 TaxID=3155415 RepID=UPI00342731BD